MLEIVASIASMVMSTVLSIVALVFTYRQNVGWRPVALVTGTMISGAGGKWHYTLHLSVEIWNRHKYPIALRFTRAKISGVEILDESSNNPDKRDFISNNEVVKDLSLMVEPSKSEKIDFKLRFENQSLDALRPLFDVSIAYFNPQKNRDETITLKHRFFYPALGWGKSDAERTAALKAFEKIKAENDCLRESMREKQQLRQAARSISSDRIQEPSKG